ncbi:MAG: ammonia channel protein, partial [Gammaproteobacteria bacterium]|nr:ammonia channel protein [Gammaproteobacteria bacterium]
MTQFAATLLLFLLVPGLTFAADGLDSGDTAWMLTATALVLFMTLPGLALFYSGLVRNRNVLSVMMQCFTIACAASLLWVIAGYSLIFGEGSLFGGLTGGLDQAFLSGVTSDSLSGTIPETVFVMFQMTFAIITPALIVG